MKKWKLSLRYFKQGKRVQMKKREGNRERETDREQETHEKEKASLVKFLSHCIYIDLKVYAREG